eukprot:Sspe_Gene.98828::Locus_72229_Transcript_2_3_Confidence_0.400_Length_450::g.98828::m.98828
MFLLPPPLPPPPPPPPHICLHYPSVSTLSVRVGKRKPEIYRNGSLPAHSPAPTTHRSSAPLSPSHSLPANRKGMCSSHLQKKENTPSAVSYRSIRDARG